jgi:4-amino-4-deoxy-L-arabinose transferase-like glycosyltransferase
MLKSFHVFRQTDCLSITDNYYNGNWNFFQPSLNVLFSDKNTTGKSAGEFPLLYYFVALLWKVFGKHEYIFRLVTIAFAFSGMLALYKLVYALVKDYFWAIASALFLFCSPIFAFYSNNFLTNVPAFSLMLIALYFFYLFWNSGRNRHLFICMVLFLVAGLLKVSSLLSFAVIGALYLGETSNLIRLKKEGKVFSQPLQQGLSLVMVLAGVLAWYAYVGYYCNLHGGKFTYNGTESYWSETKAEQNAAISCLTSFMFYQIYSVGAFVYLIACLITLAVNYRKIPMLWRVAIPLLVMGYVSFILLFFYSLNGHDYYHIDFLIIPIIINLAFLHYLSAYERRAFKSTVLKIFFALFLGYNVLYCGNNMRIRYWDTPNDEKTFRQIFAPKSETDLWSWITWSYPNGSLEKVTPVLRSMGIQRNDIFICPNDDSYSIQLYLMDQIGYTNILNWLSDSTTVMGRIKAGAKYMVISDTTTIKQPRIKPFTGHELKRFGNLRIYDLKPYSVHN